MDPQQNVQYQSGEYQPYQAPLTQGPAMAASPVQPYYQKPEQPYYDQTQQPNQQYGQQDIEKSPLGDDAAIESQINQAIRRGFIMKTYGILLSQLFITLCFIFLSFSDTVRESLIIDSPIHSILLVLSLIVVVTILIMFMCCRSTARKSPINYILLFTFTLCMSYYCLVLCAYFETKLVLEALVLTMAATIGLTVYAFKTTTDYTYCGFFLFAFLFLIPFTGFFFWWSYYDFVVFYILAGIIIYSLYIIYDTQLILGGLGLEYKIDDYVLAALNLYLDIIYLFIRLLQLLAILKGKN